MSKYLSDMAAEVEDVNLVNGWFDSDRTFGDDIALLHSEVSEAFEAYRRWGVNDVTEPFPPVGVLPKPEGVGSEFADILIRLLDSCTRHGIDLEAEYERKIRHNATRGHRHGGKLL